MEAVDVRGRFVWHQLATRDVSGAKKFYSKLVGWKTMPWPLDPAYTVCHADVGPVAGVMAIPAEAPAEMPSHWLSYIGTRDVDGTVEAAVRAGGSVLKAPSDMQGAGRYAVLKDPQGAAFAIISPENARPEAAGAPALGTFSWHELATTDHEAAFAFYSGLFGWEAMQRMDMGPTGIYLIFGWNGQQRGGMYTKTESMPATPFWLPYAHVPSADKGFSFATASGGREWQAPMEVPGGGRIAIFQDPTGAGFAVHSVAAAAAPEAPQVKAAAKPMAKPKTKPKAKAKAKPKAKPKAKAKSMSAAKLKRKGKVARKAVKKAVSKAAKKIAKVFARAKQKAKKVARRKK
jgi:predicted enzyme related to lactoylglutathione lyase